MLQERLPLEGKLRASGDEVFSILFHALIKLKAHKHTSSFALREKRELRQNENEHFALGGIDEDQTSSVTSWHLPLKGKVRFAQFPML